MKTEDVKILNVFRTNNYGKFKALDGNRTVLEPRIVKITNSIKQNGYIINPICVNEKCEIIDGQGRFESLKRLNMPIDYYTVQGAGIKDCIAMNINQTNWGAIDYVDCYANLGYQDYKYLRCLINAYSNEFPLSAIFSAIRQTRTQLTDLKHGANIGGVKKGIFKCSSSEYAHAVETLEWIKPFIPYIKRRTSQPRSYILALLFIYTNASFDKQHMSKRMCESSTLEDVALVKQAVEVIEKIYNYHLSSANKIYFSNIYQKWIDSGRKTKKEGEINND